MNNYASLVDAIIKDEMAGNPRHELLVLLGRTPGYLIEHAGFPDLELAIKGQIITKACFDHGIIPSLIKRLHEVVATPQHVFKPDNPRLDDTVVVLTFETKVSSPIIIPIQKNRRVGRANECYNLVASVYGKEGPDPIKKWIDSGLLLWSATE